MLPWTLWQVDRIVSYFMEGADDDLWAEMAARLFSLVEEGNALGWPASEPVGGGTGLFALRARAGTKQGRLFYFFMSQRRIVFVHSIALKKRRSFEQHDIKQAMKRKHEVEQADDLSRIATQFTVDSHGSQTH